MDSRPTPIRVVVVDDHAIVRKGIKALLATEACVEVVGEAGDGTEAIEQALLLSPDVVLMDIVMPRMDGIEATRQIKAQLPGTRVLILTSFAGDDKVFPAIRAGALGYLLKDSSPEDLVRAIRDAYRGESPLDPTIARKLLQEIAHPAPEQTAEPGQLTDRETEVLQLVARGYSNQAIAARLKLAEPTVRTHVSNILGKLHLTSRTQAALYALREGLVTLDRDR